jgi:hypothetical protein
MTLSSSHQSNFLPSPVQLLGGIFAHSTINSSMGRKPLKHSFCNTNRTLYLDSNNNRYLFSLVLVLVYYTPHPRYSSENPCTQAALSRDSDKFFQPAYTQVPEGVASSQKHSF